MKNFKWVILLILLEVIQAPGGGGPAHQNAHGESSQLMALRQRQAAVDAQIARVQREIDQQAGEAAAAKVIRTRYKAEAEHTIQTIKDQCAVELNRLNSLLRDAQTQQTSAHDSRIAALQSQLNEQKQQQKHLQNNIQAVRRQIATKQQRKQHLEATEIQHRANNHALEQQIIALNEEKLTLESSQVQSEDLAQQQADRKAVSDQLTAKQQQVQAVRQAIAGLTTEISQAAARTATQKAEHESELSRIEAASRAPRDQLRQEIQNLEAQKVSLEGQVAAGKVREQQAQIRTLKEESHTLSAKKIVLEAQLNRLRQEYRREQAKQRQEEARVSQLQQHLASLT